MPLVGGNYWFFTAYVILFLCSPILNHLLSAFSEKKIRLAILVALLLFGIVPIISLGNNSMQISNGYGFPWLIILYIIGGYVRLHGHAISDKIHGNLFLLGYLLFALLHVLYRISVEFITLRFLGNARFGNLFLFYNSPLIVGESVCLFLYAIRQVNTCGNRRLCSVIEYFTPGVFSVYIIHTHPLIWKHVLHNLFSGFANAGVVSISLLILLVSLSVFLVCAMLDVMRIKIFRILCVDGFIKNVSHNIEVRIAHYFYS
jgi:hypothetical protein